MFIVKSFVNLRKHILLSIHSLLRSFFVRERRYYYEQFFGTDSLFVLIVKNLLRPKRFLMKFIYGQVVSLPSMISLGSSIKPMTSLLDEWKGYLDTMKRDGVVFIPEAFKAEANNLCERYNITRNDYPPSDKYTRFNLEVNDPDILNIVTAPIMLSILAGYYGCQPYLRHLPAINCTHPQSEKDRNFRGYNNFWHYDTVNLTTAHILLNDIVATDNCMLYAKGSHRTHRVQLTDKDYYYSEEYMRDHFEIIPCIGNKGDLVLFDPNGLHRVDLKMGTFRSHLHINIVPGNDILNVESDRQTDFPCLTQSDLSDLMEIQKQSLKYVM